jgi:hypothetical protein
MIGRRYRRVDGPNSSEFYKRSDPVSSMKPMRVRGVCQSLSVVLLLFTCCALSAQNEQHRVKNVVLVHGAWADGSGWKGVYDILVKDGYNVSVVQSQRRRSRKTLPLRSASLLYRMDPAFSSVTAMAEPQSLKLGLIHRLPVWYTSQPTCQMQERMSLTTESDSPATSASLTP